MIFLLLRVIIAAGQSQAFDPNVLAAVMGSVIVAAVTTLPMYLAGKKKGNDHAIHDHTEAVHDMKAILLAEGVYTRATLQRIEKKIDEHIQDPRGHKLQV